MGFQIGDIVMRSKSAFTAASGKKIAADHVGTICKVVTADRLYRVKFQGVSICVLQFDESLTPAVGIPEACDHASCTD